MPDGRIAAKHQATRNIGHNRVEGRERGPEQERKFPTARAAKHRQPPGIHARIPRQPGKGPLKIFQRDAVERLRQPLHPEIGERQGGVATRREQRGYRVRGPKTATGAAEGEHGRTAVDTRWRVQRPNQAPRRGSALA
jgi:hypothetical protein